MERCSREGGIWGLRFLGEGEHSLPESIKTRGEARGMRMPVY